MSRQVEIFYVYDFNHIESANIPYPKEHLCLI